MTEIDDRLVSAWPALAGLAATPVSSGLINDTLALGDGYILQRLHPVFAPEVNDDIAALTPIARAAGVPVPELVRAASGATWVTLSDGDAAGVWRVLTRLPGHTLHKVADSAGARAVAEALAAFHGAFVGVAHTFAGGRLGIHDTAKHLANLERALAAHPDHRLSAAVAPVAAEIFDAWASFGPLPVLPERIGHGDPKISNFLFDDAGRVVGVIDLDTVGPTTLDAELGDALRSWCNTTDESAVTPELDEDRFVAAMEGYVRRAAGWITAAEVRAFARAPERIAFELASRFAADALNEDYFGWDPARAPTRGDHNLMRARNQLGLAQSIRAARDRLEPVAEALADTLQ